jgi:hypothetical protein
MIRRTFLQATLAAPWLLRAAPRSPIAEPHFPSRLYQFVWRNWELANTERMAEVAGTAPREILSLGAQMGLPAKPVLTADQLRRIHITVIRQNWHLLPDRQIIQLLGWTPEKYAYILKEDDFLDGKLGPKPACEPLVYVPPDRAAAARAAEIQRTLKLRLGEAFYAPGEPPFHFIEELSARVSAAAPRSADRKPPRIVYPFFALYGDPLLEPEMDPFPDGYLERLAAAGINGVWMQSVLSNMAPSRLFPEFGQRSAERLANLDKLAERLDRFGMRAYLYLNEPRSMPAAFFKGRESYRGAAERGVNAICTSVPAVREWIGSALTHVFERVPRLGGVIAITASENFTNCHSHESAATCPRCSARKPWEVIGELVETFSSGIRQASKDAQIIAWDWGWSDELAVNLIPRLPSGVSLMSVSEWSIPIERGGVKSLVGEYSVSVVGPGPRAAKHWALARKAGLAAFAKTQFNNSWEIAAVPYIPVPGLVARHCEGLRRAGVSGVMASWTLGGYPSPNLEVADVMLSSPGVSAAEALERVARRRYPAEVALMVLTAWREFGAAFEGFPYGTVPCYLVPTHHGPANLLRVTPTGVAGSMILFPQDDWKGWVGPYPPATARDLFARLAERWEFGLAALARAAELSPAAVLDHAIAETCFLHFRSVADQIDFCMLRGQPRSPETLARMRRIAERQRAAAVRMYTLTRRHSVLAFEASNHYFYRPLDCAEAVLAADYLLEHELRG